MTDRELPAFPRDHAAEGHNGMSLRDYFAAKAMQGMLADLPKTCYGLDWQANVAKAAFALADAMLDVRAAAQIGEQP
jgi:hypothetical protein